MAELYREIDGAIIRESEMSLQDLQQWQDELFDQYHLARESPFYTAELGAAFVQLHETLSVIIFEHKMLMGLIPSLEVFKSRAEQEQ